MMLSLRIHRRLSPEAKPARSHRSRRELPGNPPLELNRHVLHRDFENSPPETEIDRVSGMDRGLCRKRNLHCWMIELNCAIGIRRARSRASRALESERDCSVDGNFCLLLSFVDDLQPLILIDLLLLRMIFENVRWRIGKQEKG